MDEKEILVVDDNAGIRILFDKALTEAGFRVWTAESAEEALDILKRRDFSVFFLDLKLPGMNGIDLCKLIRHDRPNAFIYAITGYASVFELSDCIKAGFDEYFTKPISIELLVSTAKEAFTKIEAATGSGLKKNPTEYLAVLRRIVKNPVIALLSIFAITALFALQLPKLSFQTSVYDLIIEDLPETERYGVFKDIFGSDEIIRLVIRTGNVFDPPTFLKIREISDTASKINGVRRVIGLPGIKDAIEKGGEWDLDRFSQMATHVDLFQRNLVSENQKTAVLTLVLNKDADHETTIAQVNAIIGNTPKTLSLYQIGMPLVSEALAEFTERDFFRLPPLTLLLIGIILLLLFRNVQLMILPLASVLLSLTWTFGFMAITGIPMSMLTMIVPVFLVAVGTAYCLHLAFAYLESAKTAETSQEAVIDTFSHMAFPTALAVFTTVFGLGSLLVNRITAIREFAIFSCFGMFSLLVIALILIPAALAVFPLPSKKRPLVGRVVRTADAFIEAIIRINLNHQKIALPIILGFAGFCAVGITRINVETNPIGFFKKNTPVSQHFHDIYRDMSGSFPVNVVMATDEADFFENPENIARIAKFQTFLDTLPGVDKTVSFADYMKLVNFAGNRFEPEYYTLPQEGFEARMLINDYRILLGQDMLDRFMSGDLSKANILMLTHISSSRDFLAIRERILGFAKANFPKNFRWDVTGFGMVISASSHLLTKGQVKSLSITLILVFGMMFVLFLSKKAGLIALVPNLFPIVVNFGIMGWLGIELSTVTSLIASIAIGLAVDDTIHYMVRYNREFKKDLDDKRALADTLRHVGRPIVFTTLMIGVGFSILALSSFTPTAVFGLMMMITMLSALVGDAILLPSLMLHVELITLWDLVRIKLGKEPRFGIPLFKGLSKTEVHYILIAGVLKKMEKGEVLFREGETGKAMYAVVSGEVDVVSDSLIDWAPDKTVIVQEPIARLRAGEIVGEMGFIRSTGHTATVVAVLPTELIEVNWKMLRRLQWLYPPTANTLIMNLMNIICDRLEQTTRDLCSTRLLDGLEELYCRNDFLHMLDKFRDEAVRYGLDLTLCLIRIEFLPESSEGDSYNAKNKLVLEFGKMVHGEIRQCDALARLDFRTFALLLPHTSIESTNLLIGRFHSLSKKFKMDGLSLRFKSALTGLDGESDEHGSDLLKRVAEKLGKSG